MADKCLCDRGSGVVKQRFQMTAQKDTRRDETTLIHDQPLDDAL
jgi:hypothetical protein